MDYIRQLQYFTLRLKTAFWLHGIEDNSPWETTKTWLNHVNDYRKLPNCMNSKMSKIQPAFK